MADLVLTDKAKHTLIIILNRPEARNAINGEIAAGLETALDLLESDGDLWCAVLASSGTAFCAGADLKEIAAGNAKTLGTSRGGFAGIVRRKRTKPLIVAVDGPALAGGTEIVLACDMVVASARASFGLPEVKRSLVAGAGGLFRLPRLLPRPIALEMLLTGDPISAEKALHFGMVNELAAAGYVTEAAKSLADRICENAPMAVWETYAVASSATASNEDELFALSAQAMSKIMDTEDFTEGPKAFIEKRAPIWKGR